LIKWRGTAYRFHPLFSLVIIGSVLTGYFIEVITLFGIVLIHEFGHAAAAKGFGWRLKEVQLLPFGGVAVVEELGTVPAREELIVALAGPLQHLWLIGFAYGAQAFPGVNQEWWSYFIQANIMIALFNLLPILPLDGGKIIQCLLSYIMPYHSCVYYAIVISLLFSALMIVAAVYKVLSGDLQLNLLVIGLFLLYSNWYGYRQLPYHFLRFLMSRGKQVSRYMIKGTLAQPIVVNKQRKISEVLKLFMREKYHLIYVVNEKGRIQAVLPEQQLVYGYLEGKKPGSAVSELFR
jgi:stage IV sporulation protein FB